MLGAEFPAIFFRQFGDVDLADVQHRAQRQRDHAPRRMGCQPGQGDPVVPVQPLAVCRSGSRVVMDAGTFHVPAITRRGRVVHPQQNTIAEPRRELLHDQAEHGRGQLSGSPPHAGQAIVEPVPILLHACRDEPGAGGASIVGQQHPGDHNRQPKGDPAVQDRLQDGNRRLHRAGQRHFGLGGSLAFGIPALKSLAFIVLRLLGLLVFRLRTL